MKPYHFERHVRRDLRQRRWLRVHSAMIATLTLALAWATTHSLMLAGLDRLALRYGLAFAVAYLGLMGLLYLWARWLLSRDRAEADLLQIDAPTGSTGGGGRPPWEPGGGGDFGGGGASADFDLPGGGEALGEGVGHLGSTAAEIVSGADEAAVVLIPLALVVAAAMALGALLGVAVFGLFGIEVLLGVAVEIAFASVGGALAIKAQREGWLRVALGRTAGPAAMALCTVVALGAAVDHWLPEARSLPHALHLLRT